MLITWIRHGMTDGNKKKQYIGITDENLCIEGIESLSLTEYPKADSIYCSPMKRCRSTAKLIYPDKSITYIEDLKECDFGEFEGKNYMDLAQNPQYQLWIDSNGAMAFPEGESPFVFKNRCCRAFLQIINNELLNETDQIAIVAHGGTIMSILERFGCPKKDYFDWHIENGAYIVTKINPLKWSKGEHICYYQSTA